MTDALVRKRVLVRGRVQGVFFRGATQEEARRLGVAGWVRNCPDGSVEAVLEGPSGPVDALLGFLAHGPPAARVDDLEHAEEARLEGFEGFEVRR